MVLHSVHMYKGINFEFLVKQTYRTDELVPITDEHDEASDGAQNPQLYFAGYACPKGI